MSKLKIALVGLAHVHAIGFLRIFNAFKDEVEWVGFADIPDAKGSEAESLACRLEKNVGSSTPLPPQFDDLTSLLDAGPELVCIASDKNSHAEVAEACLLRNISCVIEKPMALSMSDGRRILAAARKSTATCAVNWPIAWFPAFNLAKRLVDEGSIGRLLRVTYRSPNTRGPYCLNASEDRAALGDIWWYRHDRGGGSLADYAGYGFTLATWFFGRQADRVMGLRKNFLMPFAPDIEDYSAFIADFGDGVAHAEGSWSTFSSGEIPTGPVLYGSEGTIVCDRFTPEVKVYKTFKPYTRALPPEETLAPKNDPSLNLGRQMIDHLKSGKPLHQMITLDFNLKQLAAMDAGVRSCESGIAEKTLDPFA